MLKNATVSFLDGSSVTVRILPFDMVCFERESKKPFASKDGEVFVEAMFKLAYLAAVREQTTTRTFDDWLANVTDVDMGDDPKVTPPTESSNS